MNENGKPKYQEIGTMWEGEYGPYLSLGNTRSKSEQYNYDVSIKVTNNAGQVVAILKNPKVNLRAPAAAKKDGTPLNVPANLKYKLSVKISE